MSEQSLSRLQRPESRPSQSTNTTGAERTRRTAIGFFVVALALWLVFGATLLISSDSLVNLWDRFRDWPLIAQGIVTILLLPWVVAVWIWHMDWSLTVRLILDAGLALATLYAFFPWRR